MPRRVADNRDHDHETGEPGRESDSDEEDDEAAPYDHRGHVRRKRAQAGQRGDDAVGVAVQHHRHGHHADGEYQHSEEASNAEIGEQEFHVRQRQDLRQEAVQVRHVVREEQREDHQRRAGPDQENDRQHQRKHSDRTRRWAATRRASARAMQAAPARGGGKDRTGRSQGTVRPGRTR